jgi:hypothetical protein
VLAGTQNACCRSSGWYQMLLSVFPFLPPPTTYGVVGEVEGSKLPGVVAGGLQRELVLRTVAVALPVPEGQVGPVLGDGDVADLKVLVGVAGDAPVHDAFHLEQGQQQLGRQPCIKLHACHKVCARFIYRSIICCLSSLSMSKKKYRDRVYYHAEACHDHDHVLVSDGSEPKPPP